MKHSQSLSEDMPEDVVEAGEEMPEPPAEESERGIPHMSADPINDISAAMNRFQRLLSQARFATSGSEWVEKCMNELAIGIEIAMECDLIPMRDALIDTARILHSYDTAGRWDESLPFLNNSYGVLSIMVGDIIVDKIQTSLVRRWKVLYQKAVEELDKRGIPLAKDDEGMQIAEEEEAAPEKDTAPRREPQRTRDDSSDPSAALPAGRQERDVPSARERTSGRSVLKSGNVPCDIPPLSDDSADDEYLGKDDDSGSIIAFPKSASEKIGGAVPEIRQEEDDEEDFESGEWRDEDEGITEEDVEAEEENDDEVNYADDAYEDEEDVQITEFSAQEPGRRHSAAEEDDLLFNDILEEETFAAEEKKDAGQETTHLETEDTIPLEEESGDEPDIISQPEDMVEAEGIDDQTKRTTVGNRTEAPFSEEAASFEPISAAPGQNSAVPDKRDDTAALYMQAPAEPESPERLLSRAREAMSKGAVHDAKSAALELAFAMAQIELEQAEASVSEAEQHLVDNAQAIRIAQDVVDTAERDLLQTEELLATRDGECGACHEQISAMDDTLARFQAELKDIDAQIEALQQKRAEQVNRIGNKQLEKEDVLNNESRLQTEIEALKQEVEGMRLHLNDLRSDKADKIENKRAIETDICEAREEAEKRRVALEAIKRTLNPVPEVSEEALHKDGFLL